MELDEIEVSVPVGGELLELEEVVELVEVLFSAFMKNPVMDGGSLRSGLWCAPICLTEKTRAFREVVELSHTEVWN